VEGIYSIWIWIDRAGQQENAMDECNGQTVLVRCSRSRVQGRSVDNDDDDDDDDVSTECGGAKFARLCVIGGVESRSAFGARAIVPVLTLRAPCAGGEDCAFRDVWAGVLKSHLR
jgi:hypothetical protein